MTRIVHQGENYSGADCTVPDGSITAPKIATSAVTKDKIADYQVTDAKRFKTYAGGITHIGSWDFNGEVGNVYRQCATGTLGSADNTWQRIPGLPTNVSRILNVSGWIHESGSSEYMHVPFNKSNKDIWFKSDGGVAQVAHTGLASWEFVFMVEYIVLNS